MTVPVEVLTDDEGVALDCAEQVIESGIHAFVAVGNALAEIRDRRLYRTTFTTFEGYCQQRWGFGRNRANRLIVAAEITEAIAAVVPVGTIPDSERQVRELAPLREVTDRLVPTWKDAVSRAGGGRPTADHVRAAVAAERQQTPPPAPRKRTPLPNQLFHAVYELRRSAERLERLLHDDRFRDHAANFFDQHTADLTVVAGVIGELGAARRAARP